MNIDALKAAAKQIRKDVVTMHRIGTNVGSAMSAADIIAVLYFHVLNISSPQDPNRDRFILSKGHAVSALYCALAQKGFIDPAILKDYQQNGSTLTGHPCQKNVPGIDASTGSLGHGLPIGVGMAMAAKRDSKKHRVFILMGDGECQEGTVWEGAMLAVQQKLDNLIVIVDANNLQGYGRAEDIQPIETLGPKFNEFGFSVKQIDGNDIKQLVNTLSKTPFEKDKPSAIIARTIKGKGVAEMEDQLGWHYFSVPEDKLGKFIEELDGSQ